MQRLTTTITKILTLSILMLGVVATTSAQNVDLALPDLASGQQITLTYDVEVNAPLPAGLQFIVNQGQVVDANGTIILTNDPTVTGLNTPTRVQVGFNLPVLELPATGETPLTREVILIAFAGLLALVASLGARRWLFR